MNEFAIVSGPRSQDSDSYAEVTTHDMRGLLTDLGRANLGLKMVDNVSIEICRSGVVTVSGPCDGVVVAFEKLLDRILDGFLEPPTPLL
jgi:hypothetical protein